MNIKLGETDFTAFHAGETALDEIRLGTEKLWPIFTDTFARADSATGPGTGWTNRAGVLGISNNTLYPAGGGWCIATPNVMMTSNDMEISVVYGPFVGGGSDDIMLNLGLSETGEGVFLFFNINQALLLPQFSWTAWPGAIAGQAGLAITAGDTLSFRRVGNLYTAAINGIPTGLAYLDAANAIPRDSNHRLVGAGIPGGGGYRTIDSFTAQPL